MYVRTCVCMCVYLCMYVCMCVYVCVCMHVRMYVCMYVRVCMCVYVCMYVCVYVCMRVCMYVCVCMYVYVCMCVYVCTYVCMYVCTVMLQRCSFYVRGSWLFSTVPFLKWGCKLITCYNESKLGTAAGEWRFKVRKKLSPIETERYFTVLTTNSYCRRLLTGDYILSFFLLCFLPFFFRGLQLPIFLSTRTETK